MRSLTLLREAWASLPGTALAVAHDAASHRAFAAMDAAGFLEVIEIAENGDLSPVGALDQVPDGKLTSFTYLAEDDVLVLSFASGELVRLSADGTPSPVGTVDGGVLAMAWAPDEELVVLVTGLGRYMVMTKDFDALHEAPIETDAHGEQVPVSVGWGRKETQFHGSAGKQAALAKGPSTARQSPDDDQAPRITWTGDGAQFAISSVDAAAAAKRTIRVYARDGALQSTSELVDQLEHVLAWRPVGNLIASSQRLPNKHQIVFFEPNGLRHGEFALRPTCPAAKEGHLTLRELAWNMDSTVLLVWAEHSGVPHPHHTLQLWTMNNYHWYLKQCIELPVVTAASWDAASPLTLHVTTNDAYLHYEWAWEVLRSPVAHVEHAASVAVIDGSAVLHTPFKIMNVPPPYSASRLTVDWPVKSVAFCQHPDHLERVALLSGWNGCHLEIFDPKTARANAFQQTGSVDVDLDNAHLRQLHFIDAHTLLALAYDPVANVDKIVRIELDPTTLTATQVSETLLDFACYRLCTGRGHVFLETVDGTVYAAHFDGNADEYRLDRFVDFLTPCAWMAVVASDTDEIDMQVVGLTNRSKLYAGDTTLSVECQSFLVHAQFLIFTTLSHTAHFVPIRAVLDGKLPPNVETRAVERGAQIVTAHPFGTGLVLQMPRGNLETIHPRPLVLRTLAADVAAGAWRAAFVKCRQHRIEFNVLVDLDLPRFMQAVPDVIRQLESVEYLNLLLSSLKRDDIVETTYTALESAARPKQSDSDKAGKVNRICDAVRSELEGDAARYPLATWISSIVTTHVKKTPPHVEEALTLIKQLSVTHADVADKALKYTIFLVNVDTLYNVALGMYDFALVLMVAQRSQKDPREYLAFLGELKQLPDAYRKYRIDTHLERFPRAFAHLLDAGDAYFAEAIAFMQRHGLYAQAIKYYSTRPDCDDQRRYVLGLYGQHLRDAGEYADAGITFELGGHYEKAREAYLKAGLWRSVFLVVEKAAAENGDEIDRARLAYDVVAVLHDRTEHRDAAQVLLEYAGDIEGAMNEFVMGQAWDEATRTAQLHNRADLIETHIRPGVEEASRTMLSHLAEFRTDLDQRVHRLVECRQEKAAKLAALESAEYDPALNNVDLMSDTTSMMSTFTGLTLATMTASVTSSRASGRSKTGKQKRKAERKRHAGKKGSIFEEEYLIDSARRIMDRAIDARRDVHALLVAQVRFGFLDAAQVVQAAYADLLAHFRAQFETLFMPPPAHPMQLVVDKFRLQQEMGMSPEQAEAHLNAQQGVPVSEGGRAVGNPGPPKVPEDKEWKLAILSAAP
ncbi:hypothetical protein GGF32_005270 [Allomyces javanicus]|nr:hypothetical protein GGF32_005270 [Allomyces javanicus]